VNWVVNHGVNLTALNLGSIPCGVLLVNYGGCFLAGLLMGFIRYSFQLSETIHVMLFAGLLGGLTTFSAFEMDLFNWFETGQWQTLAIYTALSVIGGFLLLALGFWLVRATVTSTTGAV
jgi:CrcB protein